MGAAGGGAGVLGFDAGRFVHASSSNPLATGIVELDRRVPTSDGGSGERERRGGVLTRPEEVESCSVAEVMVLIETLSLAFLSPVGLPLLVVFSAPVGPVNKLPPLAELDPVAVGSSGGKPCSCLANASSRLICSCSAVDTSLRLGACFERICLSTRSTSPSRKPSLDSVFRSRSGKTASSMRSR